MVSRRRVRFRQVLGCALVSLVAGIVTVVAVVPPTEVSAATVTAPGDTAGVCTQTVSTDSAVSVTKSGATCTLTFDYGTNPRTWTVPSGGLSNVSFRIRGGSGGNSSAGTRPQTWGADFSGTISSLAGGTSVYVYVADRGGCSSSGVWGGAWGGGGAGNNGSCAGGGSTEIRIGDTFPGGGAKPSAKKIVAGGGGGVGSASGCPSSGGCADGQDANGASAGARGYWYTSKACSGYDGAVHDPNASDQWSSGIGGNANNCRNAGSGGGGYAGGGAGSNISGGNDGGDGGRGSSYIEAGFAVATNVSEWTGTGANAGSGFHSGYAMYTNNTSRGQLVLSFTPTTSSVSQQPSNGQVGVALATQPAVMLQSGGAAAAGVTVTAALGTSPSPSGTQNTPALAGTLTAVTNASGVATFSNLAINGPTGSYALTFSATGYPMATSNSLTLSIGAASALKVSTQPSSGGTSGGVIPGSPAVTVVDAGGNAITSHPATSVSVTASPGTIGGTTSVSTASGVAAFTAATLTGVIAPTTHTLTFTASGLSSATSSTFTLATGGSAASLAIATQPVGGVGIGTNFGTQPVVRVVDASGNVITGHPVTTVTATIASGPSGGSLSGTTASTSSGVATFSGMKITGAGGTYTITFSATGLSSVTSSSLTINKTAQSITFNALTTKTFGNAAFGITATANSGLVVAFSTTTPAVCSVAGDTTTTGGSATAAVVTLLGAGTCTIATNQAGNDTYDAATQVTRSFTVNQAAQATLTLANSNAVSFGNTLTLATSGGSGTGAVTYSLTAGAGTANCTLNTTTGAMTFGSAGTCTVRATKAADTNYTVIQSATQTITVSRAAQSTSITSTAPSSPLPSGTYVVTATATSGLAPTLALMSGAGTVCSISGSTSGSTITFLASGTCTVLATQGGNGNYLAAAVEAQQVIIVGSLNQTITFAQPSNMNFGAPNRVLSASASSGLAVSFTSLTTSVCTVSGSVLSAVSAGQCEVKASQAGNSRYEAASEVTRAFMIVAQRANAPVIRSASVSSGAITLEFNAPSFNGGESITAYRLIATPTGGGAAVTDDSCATSRCTITGLTNGTEYTVTVAAINSVGVGTASSASPALTPVTNALAVQTLVATAGDGSLTVSWTAPADFGGGTFDRYEIRLRTSGNSWPGSATQSVYSSASGSVTLTGLSNGARYDVRVVTITSANATSYEGNTAEVTSIPRTVPAAPRELAAARTAPRSVLISWSIPADDGGAEITSYIVSLSGGASCGSVTIDATTKAGSCVASGLTLATTYNVSVVAVNVAGSSSAATTTYTTPSFAATLATPASPAPCTTCIEDDGGGSVPGSPTTQTNPGRITLTDGVVTVVLSGAPGTSATVNNSGQLQFALGGRLVATGSGALATTTMATWWDQATRETDTVDSSGSASITITSPSGTTTGVASIRVDVVSSLGAQRAFYFEIKVTAAPSVATGSLSTTTSSSSSTSSTTTSVPGGTTTTTLSAKSSTTTTVGRKTSDGSTKSTTTTFQTSTSSTMTKRPSSPTTSIVSGGAPQMSIVTSGPSSGEADMQIDQVGNGSSGRLRITRENLQPGSAFVVYLKPSMKQLAIATVGSDGTVNVMAELPDDLGSGDHRLEISMVDEVGMPRTLIAGFVLRSELDGLSTSRALGLVVTIALTGASTIFFIIARRRRREEEDE